MSLAILYLGLGKVLMYHYVYLIYNGKRSVICTDINQLSLKKLQGGRFFLRLFDPCISEKVEIRLALKL